jgi:hypothetical protein
MAAINDITGDKIATRSGNATAKENFDNNFDLIFRKKKPAYSEDWQSEERDRAIAQNGPTGEHYKETK